MIFSKQMVYRILLLILLSPLALQAQNRTGPRFDDASPASTYQQLQQRFAIGVNTISGLIAMEGALDAEAYLVGPGDQFSVSIGGATPLQTIMPVSAEGNLLLFDLGSIPAAGKSLSEVRNQAIESLREQYQHVPVDVSLIQPRRFYVHLAGTVPEPGRYVMLPLARLDDAIQQAFASQATARPDPTAGNEVRIVGSATAEISPMQAGFKSSLRNVHVNHRDGTSHSYDLFRYYVLGDLDHNPYLYDGDVIHLATYNEERDAILVTGDVASPGRIEFRAGDTILDALRIASNNPDIQHFHRARLTRRSLDADTPASMNLDVAAMLTGDAPPFRLMAGDHINIETVEVSTAAIYGQVTYPGTFPIENGRTTLRELIELAGGLKPEADPATAYIERRRSFAAKPDAESSELDFFERTYFRRSMAQNRLSIDVEEALKPDTPDVILYNGDLVLFPRDEQIVFVSGNAVNPGYVPYTPNRTAAHYIELAGGQGALSSGVYIFEAGTGNVHTDLNAILDPGDTVFINRESVADSPELQSLLITDQVSKRQTKIATTQTIITGITALVSVVNTFLLIRDRLGN